MSRGTAFPPTADALSEDSGQPVHPGSRTRRLIRVYTVSNHRAILHTFSGCRREVQGKCSKFITFIKDFHENEIFETKCGSTEPPTPPLNPPLAHG